MPGGLVTTGCLRPRKKVVCITSNFRPARRAWASARETLGVSMKPKRSVSWPKCGPRPPVARSTVGLGHGDAKRLDCEDDCLVVQDAVVLEVVEKRTGHNIGIRAEEEGGSRHDMGGTPLH